jgi:hypothetical protein
MPTAWELKMEIPAHGGRRGQIRAMPDLLFEEYKRGVA